MKNQIFQKMKEDYVDCSFLGLLLAALFIVSACNRPVEKVAAKKTEINQLVSSDLKWSERMALTLMHAHPEAWQLDDREEPKWDYVHGLVLKGFQDLYHQNKNKKYYNYVKGYGDKIIAANGTIATYKLKNYNIDMINAGKILFDLYSSTGDNKYRLAMDNLRLQIQDHPRTNSNGFWHKKRYPYQMWLDGLYMGQPFYARYTMEFENGANFDDVVHQFQVIHKQALDPKTGLLYHAWDESKKMGWADKVTGNAPNFWSRAMGWYAMALVDVLDYIPENHKGREEIIGYLQGLAKSLSNVQHESGLWYQVPNMGTREGNYLEASGTSMFAYALAKGANKGYLSKTYKDVAQKAFDELVRVLIKVDSKGLVTITEVCAVAGLGGDPYRDGSYEYYINERKKDNDPKATGPFIMAALQLNR